LSNALTKKDLEDLVKSYKSELGSINSRLENVIGLPEKFTKPESLIDKVSAENKELRKIITERDAEIFSLKAHVNSLEQHNRSWSVRVMGLPLTNEEEKSASLVKKKLFSTVIQPILAGTVTEGDLPMVPSDPDLVIEMAHPLRAKEGSVKPIIARFYGRELRQLVFKHKKAYAPKHESGSLRGKYVYQVFEDLTKTSFQKMRALAADKRVDACWSANGQLHNRLVGDPTVRRVANILDPVSKILG
jgi:hypothetical protein